MKTDDTLRLWRGVRKPLFLLSLFCGLTAFVLSCRQFRGATLGAQPALWWIISMVLLVAAASGAGQEAGAGSSSRSARIVFFTALAYFGVHLFLLPNAPWNENGLFDDAAWDIYFANEHVFAPNVPFQAAYWDEIGAISREVLFHYYIVTFFKCFGYNLLSFNYALLCLGYVTLVFTVLAVDRLCRSGIVTIVAALVMGTFPLYVTQIFIGHRYAMAPPLIAASYYCLVTAFQAGSPRRPVLGGLLGAFCVESAVMGKQYLIGLVLSAVLLAVFHRREVVSPRNARLCWNVVLGAAVGLIPLLVYVIYNTDAYYVRERNLVRDFKLAVSGSGLTGLEKYIDDLLSVFFASRSDRRFFSPDYHAIPLLYYSLIIPGFFVALRRRRAAIVLLSLLPVAGAFVAGCTDFRILICVPFWVMAACLSVDAMLKQVSHSREALKRQRVRLYKAALFGAAVVVLLGAANASVYLVQIARDPNSMWFLPHRDVAVARVIQDVACGVERPSPMMKRDEFQRRPTSVSAKYDVLASPASAYAIAHLYLQFLNHEQILSFNRQITQRLLGPAGVREANIEALNAYKPAGRDLKLLWEVTEDSLPSIEYFSRFSRPAAVVRQTYESEGGQFTVCTITVASADLKTFQESVWNNRAQASYMAAQLINALK